MPHHAIFAWNRLGLSAQEQKSLSELPTEVVMTEHTSTDLPPASDAEAARLRHTLAEQLREQGHVTDERIDEAIRTVPRHVFVPGASLEGAYANDQLYTKNEGRVMLSAASKPSIVAMQLAQLAADKDQRILEVGAGTGYNAALMGHLVGPGGHVTTVDVDDDLVAGAREHLAEAGVTNVDVFCQDGALGVSSNAPYDRIVATVGTADLAPAWLEQAAPTARLVIPLRIAGSVARSIIFERDGDHWKSLDSELCAFMPLRDSSCTDTRRYVDLTSGGQVVLHAYREQDVDAEAVHGVLDTPAHTAWSGVEFGKAEPLDPVWLWLGLSLPNAVSRMEVQRSAKDSGLVHPMLPWGSMTTVEGDSLAYLTTREGKRGHEMGAIGHGPAGRALAERMVREIATWSDYRSAQITFEFRPNGTSSDPPEAAGPGEFVVTRPSGRLTVTWRT